MRTTNLFLKAGLFIGNIPPPSGNINHVEQRLSEASKQGDLLKKTKTSQRAPALHTLGTIKALSGLTKTIVPKKLH